MKTAILTLFIFVMSTSAIEVLALPKCKNMNSLDFEARIDLIHSKVDLTDIFALHNIKEFNEIYFNPLDFEFAVLNYLQKPVDFEKKIIAICSMTKLPTKQYIDLLSTYYNLYCKHKINEALLNRCFFNEFDTNNRFEREYKNQRVKTLVINMINQKSLSKQFRNDLRETLTGKRYAAIERFKRSQ